MKRALFIAAVVAACAAPACRADAPAFDRPGLAFAPAVLPQGSFDWEQGLPDVERDRSDGERTTLPGSLLAKVVARDGIEPPTRGFSVPCSTN